MAILEVEEPSLLDEFLDLEAAGGVILIIAALTALILANTPLSVYYDLLLSTPVSVQIANLEIAKPLLLWINDGLMAIFFFVVGLELKRELIEGELSKPENLIMPAVGAIGGILVPGLIYAWLNWESGVGMQGWAIPTATDIAFALGILSLLGSKIPLSVKVFLTSLAIFDDVAAIVIIAIFYTDNISTLALYFVIMCMPILLYLNLRGTDAKFPFLFIGILMWIAMLKSGIHATLTGVIVALFIPLKCPEKSNISMAKSLESDLHGTVAFFVLPLFAFANAGISLSGIGAEQLLHPVPLGIALGLFIGKQLGIFTFCWIAIRLGVTKLPKGMSYGSLYGTAALCGIGFTMSLFIGSLAFEATGINSVFDERLGIILGSVMSGVVGYFVLRACYSDSEAAK
ncbi:MAG: Na(+)/H(+) antiporter NhaA [Pseudohongiella sp.]|nr:MAG: Na(+)/H(+) antiporter NhaA [Pseudohongiella sp.]